jgi:endonuclease/exonuclease/phosphatase family metal-dependent hydrolase
MLLLRHDPDVIGLQEVDLAGWGEYGYDGQQMPSHADEIAYDLAAYGYEGVFARKGGCACDGVGLFWKKSRVARRGPQQVWPLGVSVHVALAQSLVLADGQSILAVVTHLKAGLDAGAENMRRAQVSGLLQILAHQIEPVVLLADLNAHCRPFTPAEGAPVEPFAYTMMLQSFRSAYKEALDDELDFTCWAGYHDRDIRGVFDYILLRNEARSKSAMRVLAVLDAPSAEEVLAAPQRLPNPRHPTDHIELVADIALPLFCEGTRRRRCETY